MDIISCLLQDFNFAECCSRVIVGQQHAQVVERNIQSLSSVSLPYPAFAAATNFTQYRCLTYILTGSIYSISYMQRFVGVGHSFCHELWVGKANRMHMSHVKPQRILQCELASARGTPLATPTQST